MTILLGRLRADGARPRVHGNGFIQLDLTPLSRLHVWGDPRIPRQRTETAIHDHVFGFRSHVVVGRVVNVRYLFIPWASRSGMWDVYEPAVRQGEDTVLHPTGVNGDVETTSTDILSEGQAYRMDAGSFHETFTDRPSATIMTKDGPTLAQNPGGPRPRVLVRAGERPDNAFDRYAFPEDACWGIIRDVLGRRCDL